VARRCNLREHFRHVDSRARHRGAVLFGKVQEALSRKAKRGLRRDQGFSKTVHSLPSTRRGLSWLRRTSDVSEKEEALSILR